MSTKSGQAQSDVDLSGGLLTVARSYDGDTTKGGIAATIPIAPPLVPYLKAAIAASTSEWVFPGPGGAMRTNESDPQKVLRTALKRAGIVEGYAHVCRRCKAAEREGHTTKHPDAELRTCTVEVKGKACGMKLWPRALPRPLRFHDLRHTAATLMLRAGVDAHRVQRVLRYSNVTVTTAVYGHLIAEDLRSAVGALPVVEGPRAVDEPQENNSFGPPVVRRSANSPNRPRALPPNYPPLLGISMRSRQNSNLRPLASEASALSS